MIITCSPPGYLHSWQGSEPGKLEASSGNWLKSTPHLQECNSSTKSCICSALDSWIQPVAKFWQFGPLPAKQDLSLNLGSSFRSQSSVTLFPGFDKIHPIWSAVHHYDYSIFSPAPLHYLLFPHCEHELLHFQIPLSQITCFHTK